MQTVFGLAGKLAVEGSLMHGIRPQHVEKAGRDGPARTRGC